MMHIAVVNVNTSRGMTEEIRRAAVAAASDGTEIYATQPHFGPESVEGSYDSFISAAAVLDVLAMLPAQTAGVVLAGFGEHGREGARELLDVPVVDITEAAAMLAQLLGARYGVLTTLQRCVVQIEDSLRTAGLLQRCATIEATGLGVLEVDTSSRSTLDALERAGQRALEKGADVICLGCAGMVGAAEELGARLGVPVVDGVAAAVQLVEALINLGLRTSKHGPFATPLVKARPGWPPRA
jgi:allantoin racemase